VNRGRRILLICVFVAVITVRPLMSAINVDSIVTVRISDKNNDWLEFTIRQTAIPNDYVIRELLCTIEMTTKENRRVQKTFQLTKFRPFFRQ
jgi:hypothetical protein